MFDTDSTMRVTTPFWRLPVDRLPLDLPVDAGFLAEDVARDELRGDLAAEVFAAEAVFVDLAPFPFDEVERVGFLLLPLAVVFDLADVVLRAEDDLELPVFDVPADRDPPRAQTHCGLGAFVGETTPPPDRRGCRALRAAIAGLSGLARTIALLERFLPGVNHRLLY